MREFINEYGLFVAECIGGVVGLGVLYAAFFYSGPFPDFVTNFLKSLMGG